MPVYPRELAFMFLAYQNHPACVQQYRSRSSMRHCADRRIGKETHLMQHSSKLNAVESIRGLACLAVVFSHLSLSFYPYLHHFDDHDQATNALV